MKLDIQMFSTPFKKFENLPSKTTPVNSTNLNYIQTATIDVLGLDKIAWSSSTTYTKGRIVYYNGHLYLNTTGTSTSTNPASDTTNWEATSISESLIECEVVDTW